MTKLEVSKILNTKTSFLIDGNTYTLIMVDADDSTKYKCLCVDTTNGMSITTIPILAVPSYFTQYIYRFANASVFDRDNVIYAYKKTTKVVNEITAIINACTEHGISFTYRNTGGEIVSQMLTPKQVNDEGI